MSLLFERFLSEERTDSTGHKAWPDIDLDLPSGDQREKVIQHVYQRYGSAGAAVTAHAVTYRARPAPPGNGQGPGPPPEGVDRRSKPPPRVAFPTHPDSPADRPPGAGVTP